MAHTTRDKRRLLLRVRRLRGQLDSVERALEGEEDCSVVLQRLAACRGALGGLLVEILEGHVRQHIVDPDKRPRSPQTEAAEELINVIRSYLR